MPEKRSGAELVDFNRTCWTYRADSPGKVINGIGDILDSEIESGHLLEADVVVSIVQDDDQTIGRICAAKGRTGRK